MPELIHFTYQTASACPCNAPGAPIVVTDAAKVTCPECRSSLERLCCPETRFVVLGHCPDCDSLEAAVTCADEREAALVSVDIRDLNQTVIVRPLKVGETVTLYCPCGCGGTEAAAPGTAGGGGR